jgi:hypothetical protein
MLRKIDGLHGHGRGLRLTIQIEQDIFVLGQQLRVVYRVLLVVHLMNKVLNVILHHLANPDLLRNLVHGVLRHDQGQLLAALREPHVGLVDALQDHFALLDQLGVLTTEHSQDEPSLVFGVYLVES